jgi:hypothetical protein
MTQFHRLALAYDLLEGDWDARFVLIDLLSDVGDDELVEFARTHKQINRPGDLELAIRLLPVRKAILLGCAFLDRGMTGKGIIRRHSWLIARLAQVRRLIKSDVPIDQITRLGRALTGYEVAMRPAPKMIIPFSKRPDLSALHWNRRKQRAPRHWPLLHLLARCGDEDFWMNSNGKLSKPTTCSLR